MDKLRYKFKKIIRFINKILRLILIFGCLASLLTFNASAAVYRNDDNFFDAFSNSSCWLYSDTTEEDYVLGNRTKATYTYYYSVPSSIRNLNFISIYVDESILDRLSAGNVFIIKGSLLVRSNLQNNESYNDDEFVNYLVSNKCPLSVGMVYDYGLFTMESGIKPSFVRREADNRGYAQYDFDIYFTVPEKLDHYVNVELEFRIDLDNIDLGFENSSLSLIYLASDDFHLYVGDENNAPIYPEYDSSMPDNIGSMEDAALEDAAEGLDEIGSFFNVFENIFYNGGPTVAGLQFIGMFMNDLYLQIPWLNILLVISLSLGIVTVILGVFNIVKKGR